MFYTKKQTHSKKMSSVNFNFNFSEAYTLNDNRVLLRPLCADDFDNLLPFAVQEPEIWQYSLVSAAGAEGLKRYIQEAISARERQQEYPFIVYDKQREQYAGSTRFYDIQLYHKTIQIGYTWYGKQFQGTGLNRHCKYLLLSFAFEKLGMERVEFRADVRNARSVAAMKKIGCTVEGVLRNHLGLPNGERRNSIVLSILRNEWFEQIKNSLYPPIT